MGTSSWRPLDPCSGGVGRLGLVWHTWCGIPPAQIRRVGGRGCVVGAPVLIGAGRSEEKPSCGPSIPHGIARTGGSHGCSAATRPIEVQPPAR